MKQTYMATLFVALNLIGLSAFAAGRMAQLPLIEQSKTTNGNSCSYVANLDMGEAADLNPIQVFTLFQGKYQLLISQPTLTPEKNGRLTMRLSSYKEVAEGETCPAYSELLIVK